jgi:flagellar assembly protein FliH
MDRKSTVIKAAVACPMEGVVLKPFQFGDMLGEVQEALEAARAEAASLVKRARAEEDRVRRAAWEKGYGAGKLQGYQEGSKQGRAEAFENAKQEFAASQKSLVESCRQTISLINDGRAAWEASARQDLVDLAMAIARRVAHHVSERDRRVVQTNLEQAVRLAGARSEVTIMVHPADAESAGVFAKSLMDMREQWQHVQFVEDAGVSPGGCRIQWNTGAVDARIDTQLDRIAAELGVQEKQDAPPAADSSGETGDDRS